MKTIAAVISQWSKNSHADVILSRILEPAAWGHSNRFQLQLKSIYVDHFPDGEFAREMSAKHGFTIQPDICSAINAGGLKTAVDGVLVIGEHGPYPRNSRGQQLYPRRKFLDEVAEALRRGGKTLPVFSDKHFSYEPLFAQWILQTYRHEQIPFMAGSSLPVGWRFPEQTWPAGKPVRRAFVQGYSDLDAYGFHTLETLQCQVERRLGGGTGVVSVQSVSRGTATWENPDWPMELWRPLKSLYENRPRYQQKPGSRSSDEVWKIKYKDGLEAFVGMFSSEGNIWGVTLEGPEQAMQSTLFELEENRPYGHFGYLTRAIEHFITTGQPPYPVERTYLTTGMLAAALQSRSEGGREVRTPFLSEISYPASEWPFARGDVGNPA